MTTIDEGLTHVGEELVRYAAEVAEFSAQRGLVDELFPYIYQASRRMSTRAISRFLKEEQGIKLSAVTIAKALKAADEYWLELYESVEPAARVFGAAHDIDTDDVLELEAGHFDHLCGETTLNIVVNNSEQFGQNLGEYQEAVSILQSQWFKFDEDTRQTCLASVPEEKEEGEEEKMEGDKENASGSKQ